MRRLLTILVLTMLALPATAQPAEPADYTALHGVITHADIEQVRSSHERGAGVDRAHTRLDSLVVAKDMIVNVQQAATDSLREVAEQVVAALEEARARADAQEARSDSLQALLTDAGEDAEQARARADSLQAERDALVEGARIVTDILREALE